METYLNLITEWAQDYGMKILGALVLFIIGRIVIGGLLSIIKKVVNRSFKDETLTKFIASLTRMILLTILSAKTSDLTIVCFIVLPNFVLYNSITHFPYTLLLVIFKFFFLRTQSPLLSFLQFLSAILMFPHVSFCYSHSLCF